MASSPDTLDTLEKELSRLSTIEDKLRSVKSYLESQHSTSSLQDTSSANIHSSEHEETDRFKALLLEYGIYGAFHQSEMRSKMAETVKPLEFMPCANVNISEHEACTKKGKMACSACKLVMYCSKTCQTEHWRLHKHDCKNPLRSASWKPAWMAEQRTPSFITSEDSDWHELRQPMHHLRVPPVYLWGNMPAYDVLGSARRMTQSDQDYNAAFVASGDLRNVICMVNSLPSDYSGHLTTVLNDKNPYVTLRNILLLSVLGSTPDIKSAAEIALHLWYSISLPADYYSVIMESSFGLFESSENGRIRAQFSPNSFLSAKISSDLFMIPLGRGDFYAEQATREFQRVQLPPSQVDNLHRWFCLLDPSHRVACLEYRRSGIVLPFGAPTSHFNMPNFTLFAGSGRWLQDDAASPLAGWDLLEVIKTGMKYGTPRSDIYGCLYFFLTEQLRLFAERIQRFRITFHIFHQDACELNEAIRSNELSSLGIPSTIRFDKIDVSNIMDPGYVGVAQVISQWGVLLVTSPNATLVGYFMNWAALEPGATPQTADNNTFSRLFRQVIADLVTRGKVPKPTTPDGIKDLSDKSSAYLSLLMTRYENSEPFEHFLEKQGMAEALRNAHLKRRMRHAIMPHRLGTKIGSASTALPVFSDNEAWYLNACVNPNVVWSERFVEIVRA